MLASLLLVLAAVTALLWIASLLEAGLGMRRIRPLRCIPPLDSTDAPPVTVVIAARNEERNIEEAIRSVLAQRYARLEVLVVNDRSTDHTGEILDRVAAGEPRLRVVHLTELPPGWLGKNHALQRGADAAAGEWILFTDADVVMQPTALSRAMWYSVHEGLDHLAVTPRLLMPGPVLDTFAGAFAVFFARFARPWKARDPRSRRHVGIGAFNLVRASAYAAVGGHWPIAMRPDDDLKLGKVLKSAGCRQDLAIGEEMVSVEWYGTLGEAVRGLEKNTFAGLNYSVLSVVFACLVSLAIDVWPFVAIALTHGPTRWLNALSASVAVLTYMGSTRASGTRPIYGLAYPIAALLILFIVVRSTALALRNGGIRWRDTFYPLDQLRANRV